MIEVLLNPFIAFVIFLLIGYIIYLVGGSISPKLGRRDEALTTYACGEDVPGEKVAQAYALYHIALCFTILHSGVLLAAIMYPSAFWLGVFFLTSMMIAVASLIWR